MKLTREKKIEFSRMLVSKVKILGVSVKPSRAMPVIVLNKKERKVEVTQDFNFTTESKDGFYLLKKQDFKSVHLDNNKNIIQITDTFAY